MNWLSKITPPGMSKIFSKRDTPDNLWVKCPVSGEMVFQKDLEAGQFVTPAGHHMRIGPAWRFQFTFDGGVESVVLVQNFAFMGGSLGMAAGESFIKAAETAIAKRAPLIVFTAAGGARMQEGALSLMQMPRTTIAVEMMRDAGLPYIVVLTDPTTGGVTASYAMLGDVQIAEPGALIGFAGPRVIEQTIREKLPEGFQRAEYLLEKGMIDQVVHRHEIPATLARMLRVLMKRPSASSPGRLAPPSPDHVAADGGAHERPTPGR